MRILLADGESNVRYGLRVLLEEGSGFEVVGEAADAEDLLVQVEAACPDLLLLSWGLPGLAGADLLPALRRVCDDMYVIVLSGRPEARQAVLDAGANAFVSKVESPERLLAAIASAGHCHRSTLERRTP
jgi:two-component system invasion response regulator UvrY